MVPALSAFPAIESDSVGRTATDPAPPVAPNAVLLDVIVLMGRRDEEVTISQSGVDKVVVEGAVVTLELVAGKYCSSLTAGGSDSDGRSCCISSTS